MNFISKCGKIHALSISIHIKYKAVHIESITICTNILSTTVIIAMLACMQYSMDIAKNIINVYTDKPSDCNEGLGYDYQVNGQGSIEIETNDEIVEDDSNCT